MRKIFSLGLLAVAFSFMSPSIMSGQVPWCDAIKDKPEYKGLYGLCNAYWNESDDLKRVDIFAAWQQKTDLEMPGPGLSCPCWEGVVLDDIGEHTAPAFCFEGTNMYAFFTGESGYQNFTTEGIGCFYDADYLDDSGARIDIYKPIANVGDDGTLCLQEMEQILIKYWSDGGGGYDCSRP